MKVDYFGVNRRSKRKMKKRVLNKFLGKVSREFTAWVVELRKSA
jgi:hypothetical protein